MHGSSNLVLKIKFCLKKVRKNGSLSTFSFVSSVKGWKTNCIFFLFSNLCKLNGVCRSDLVQSPDCIKIYIAHKNVTIDNFPTDFIGCRTKLMPLFLGGWKTSVWINTLDVHWSVISRVVLVIEQQIHIVNNMTGLHFYTALKMKEAEGQLKAMMTIIKWIF